MGSVRWGLWGAPQPKRQPSGRFLLCFGAACWLYVFFHAGPDHDKRLGPDRGSAGLDWGRLVGTPGDDHGPWPVPGVAGGEVAEMIRVRHKRTAAWVVVVGVLPAVFATGQLETGSAARSGSAR